MSNDRTVRRRRSPRFRSSVLAQGEAMVWLTGGGLVLAVLMIIGLLGLVAYFGLSTFWPMPIERTETYDGRVYMGEVTRDETYHPDDTYLDRVDPAIRARVAERLGGQNGAVERRLFRTGNYRLTQKHFQWVDEVMVAKSDCPEWAMTVERLEWGRFYGFPEAAVFINFIPQKDNAGHARPKAAILAEARLQVAGLLEHGAKPAILVKTWIAGREQEAVIPVEELESAGKILGVARLTEGPEAAWQQFSRHHAPVRSGWRQRRYLEKHAIGEVNRALEKSRLAYKSSELKLDELASTEGRDSARYRAAESAYATAKAHYDEATKAAQAKYAALREEINRINQDNGRYRLLMRTAGEETSPPQEALLRLDDIVRAYPANRLSTRNRLGIYLSRWWEFLSAEPREANSEGGVFPAIFGTVTMTFIMILVVVPFGVLASLYLREYAKAGPIVSVVRIAVNNLAGVPSIVFGVFGLGFFCYGVGSFLDGGPSAPWRTTPWLALLAGWLAALVVGIAFCVLVLSRIGWKSSAGLRFFKGLFLTLWVGAMLAGVFVLLAQLPFFDGFFRARLPNPTFGKGGLLWASLTLALMTLPVVIVATEEALSAVPNSMREGSYACGASKWQTIRRIVLPRAMPGIMTGTVLAMARGAGEVAPLMLVGAVKLAPELPVDGLFPFLHAERSFMHLGFHIYDVGLQSQNSEAAKPMVYTTTLLLILLVVLMNLFAIFLRGRLRRRLVSQAF